MKIKDIPTINDVKDAIARLKSKTFPTFSKNIEIDKYSKEITDSIAQEFGFAISIKQPIKLSNFSSIYFRAREMNSFLNIDLIREHSYPPIDKVKIGRCNFPQFPVFYCSNNAMTALLETVKNIKGSDNKYCLSKWELIKSDEDLTFESYLHTDLPQENDFQQISKGIEKRISEPFYKSLQENLSKEQEEAIIEYLRYFNNRFINDSDYSISASIAYSSLYAKHKFRTDILMYPSVQSYYKGVNLAIHPNFVENNLKMTRLYVVQLDNFNPNTGLIKVNFSRYADVEKNTLVWKKILPNDNVYANCIKEDFGEVSENEFVKNKLP